MNQVMICGRLTREPVVRYTNGENPMAVARYTLAVDRRRKSDGTQEADFISCIAFGKQGEFAEKYLHQGMKMLVRGSIRTGNYTNKDGQKVYTTDVVVEEHEFCESKNSSGNTSSGNAASGNTANTASVGEYPYDATSIGEGFMSIPDGIEDEGLPFN